jgi:hypothetical protein
MEDTRFNMNTRVSKQVHTDFMNYKAQHVHKPFDRVPYELLIRLSEDHIDTDIRFNVYEHCDNLNKTVLNQTCELSLCSLTLDAGLLTGYDLSALFASVSSVNSSIIGSPYQFKLIPLPGSLPGKLTFQADCCSFAPFAPFQLDTGYIRICDMAGPVSFQTPYGRTTATAGLLSLSTPVPVVGDIVVIKKQRGLVTAVGINDFSISFVVPDGVVDYYLPRYDISIHLRAIGLIPY